MVMQILEEEEEEEMKQSLALQLLPLRLPLRPSSSSSELDNNQININHSVVNVNHRGFRSFHIDINQTPLCEEDNDDDQIIKPYNREHRDQHDLVPHNINRAYCFVNSNNLINNMINDLNPDDLVEEDPQRLASSTRKKLRLSKDQSAMLEECFRDHPTLNPKQKNALAKQLKLRPRQVEVWFQNRRARTKLKQTEVDCELLKHCCESLREENRRLMKEVQELQARRSQGRDNMLVATLALCPSCERRTVPAGACRFLPPSHFPQP